MFESSKLTYLNFIFLSLTVQICLSEPSLAPHLSLYSPEEPEYTEVLVKRVGDNLTLTCEIKGDQAQRLFVWNYVAVNGTSSHRPFEIDPVGPTDSSTLLKSDMQLEDSGQYMCSSPPFSVTKFVLVQTRGLLRCARGAFSCGVRCVMPAYVCDGRADCERGEDEAPPVCPTAVCQRPEMLNCSTGRCVPAAACCQPGAPLCQQPSCCSEHAPYNRAGEGYMDVEYPALYEDRHSPDDYGFIQSTIYTVTACALIFMIAVVLLVSALCKMHMKRAALRSYARAAAARHYTQHQAARFPPCYEASLLDQDAGCAPSASAPAPPVAMATTPDPQADDAAPDAPGGYGLSRLGAIFSARYRQVPTECDVEMTTVRSRSLHASPARSRPRLDDYRSPAYCGHSDDCYISADTGSCGRELNLHPVELYRSRLEARRLTLQLGRFQLSLPRLGRPPADTYTRNGRTIRLLGGNFENYPRPPPYDPRKIAGPPPEYLSRDALNNAQADAEATSNVEMPPRYEDVNSNEALERSSAPLHAIRESGESLDAIGSLPDANANDLVSD